MPNGRVHRRVGQPVGAFYAGFQANRSTIGDPILEGVAGWFGGTLGAEFPDVLEPACWNHRRLAHSVSVAALLGASAEKVQGWAESCRVRAVWHQTLAGNTDLATIDQVWHSLAAASWILLAGFLNGVLAGYLSHLVLDAITPACIPIV